MQQTSVLHLWRMMSFFCFFLVLTVFSWGLGCNNPPGKTDGSTNEPVADGVTKLGKEGEACAKVSECETGLLCKTSKCTKPECMKDADCSGKKCISFTCQDVGEKCTSNADCPAGEDCVNIGADKFCKKATTDAKIEKVVILTSAGAVREGGTRQFEAAAYNKSGARLSGTFAFKWKSSAGEIAAINETSGLATGGIKDGETNITAELEAKTSEPVKLRNFAKVADGSIRVVVFDFSGKPVSDATVQIAANSGKTDAQGAVTVQGTAPVDIHIFHKDFAYFSAFKLGKTDLFVQLAKKPDDSKVGGIKGQVNLDKVKDIFAISDEEWPNYTVDIGITSLSIPPDILGLNVSALLGESFPVSLFGQNLSLPSGVTLKVAGGGKAEYQAQSDTNATRVAWTLGGKFKIAELTPIITAIQGGGSVDVGKILVQVKPFLERFVFGFQGDISVTTFAKVPDTKDINGNKKTDDLVPDFDKFPVTNLTPDAKLDKSLTVNVASYPTFQKDGKSVPFYAISLAGVLDLGFGIVPLGLAIDEAKDAAKTLTIKYAEPKGVLRSGKFVVVTLALTLPLGENPPPTLITSDVQIFDAPPSSASVAAFIGLGTDAKFDPSGRKLNPGSNVSSASAYQLDLSGGKARWIVLGNGSAEITLPAVPAGFEDPVKDDSSASLRGVNLKNSLTLDALLEFNATNMDNLALLLKGFSNVTIYEKKAP